VLAAAAAVAVLVSGACTSGRPDGIPRLHRTTTATAPGEAPTTTAVDASGLKLASVPGRTTTTMRIEPGEATITGMVTGPQGPVGGAVVHAERLVGEAVATKDVVSNADGTYAVANVLGGRYRVRAYQPSPANLAQTTPALLFVGARESKLLNLQIDLFSGLSLSFALAPSQLVVGQSANLVVQVTNQSVDAKGVVSGLGIPAAKVQMVPGDGLVVDTVNPGLTDGAGRAAFGVHCATVGSPAMSAVVNDQVTFPLAMPPCNSLPVVTAPPSVPQPLPVPTFPVPGRPVFPTIKPPVHATTTARFTTTRPSFPFPTR